jgi:cell division control protein 6
MDTPFEDSNNIFKTRDPFKEGFVPDQIFERDDIFDKYTRSLQSIVDGFGPTNIFIFGDSGLGKTAVTNKMIQHLKHECDNKNMQLTVIKMNCNKLDTTYSVIRYIANQLNEKTYKQGHHKTDLWDAIYTAMDSKGGEFLFILDEIDQLGSDDELLYDFPRARSMGELEHARVGVIGISNNQLYKQNLSPRVKSTLCDTEIRFDPYDATELRTILDYYSNLAFKEDVMTDSVISLCAAITAKESGDARYALDLLETSGAIARRDSDNKVKREHFEQARSEIEEHKIKEIYQSGLTTQQKMVLLATNFLVVEREHEVKLKSIYDRYCDICTELDNEKVTKRRVNDFCQMLTEKGLLTTDETNIGAKGGRWFSYSTLVSPISLLNAVEECGDRTGEVITPPIKTKATQYDNTTANKQTVQTTIDR